MLVGHHNKVISALKTLGLRLPMSPGPSSRQLTEWPEQGMPTGLLQSQCTFCSGEPMQVSWTESEPSTHGPQLSRVKQEDDRWAAATSVPGYSSLLWIDHSAVYLLDLLRSVSDFRMYYVQFLTKLIFWMFAMEHFNSAPSLSVHIRDLTVYAYTQEHSNIVLNQLSSSLYCLQQTTRVPQRRTDNG